MSLEFTDPGTAARFERYLKTGSGRAFARLGAQLVPDLESGSAMDAAVPEQITFAPRRGALAWLRDFLTGKTPRPGP